LFLDCLVFENGFGKKRNLSQIWNKCNLLKLSLGNAALLVNHFKSLKSSFEDRISASWNHTFNGIIIVKFLKIGLQSLFFIVSKNLNWEYLIAWGKKLENLVENKC